VTFGYTQNSLCWGGTIPAALVLNFNGLEVEFARSFEKNTGVIAGYEHNVPDWRVTPSCSNLSPVYWPNIDYNPSLVNDNNFPGWITVSVCAREVPAHKWVCASAIGISGFALGSTASGGYCDYNP